MTSLLEVSVTRRPRYRGPLLHANNRARPYELGTLAVGSLAGGRLWQGALGNWGCVVSRELLARRQRRRAGHHPGDHGRDPRRGKHEVPGRGGYAGGRGSAAGLGGLGPHDRLSRDSARDRTGESLRATRWAVQVTRWNVRLCYANLIAQAVLLAVSLAALAYGLDLVPLWLAIVVAVGGVGLLAWTLLRGAGIRDGVERAIRLAPSGDEYQYPGPGWGGAVDR